MKLVNLEQKIFIPIEDQTKGGATYEIQMTIEEMFDKFFEGNVVELVDAVPVAWLEAHKTEHYEDWGENPVTVEKALDMWRKDQEAGR